MKPPIIAQISKLSFGQDAQSFPLTKSTCKVDPSSTFTTRLWVCVEKVSTNGSGGDDGSKVMHSPAHCKNPPRPGLGIVQSGTDQVIPNNLEWQDQPEHDQSVLGLEATTVVLGVHLADEIKQEVSDHETEDGAYNWRCVDGGKIAKVEVICRDN